MGKMQACGFLWAASVTESKMNKSITVVNDAAISTQKH